MRDGDQHRDCNAINNPYVSKMTELDSLKVATLKARLDQQLGPEYISTRSNGSAGKVSYLEGHKAIMLANEVFGFDGWNTSIVRYDIDFLDQRGETWDLGMAVIVRITLKCGTYREDTGYGSIKNCRDKAMAFEKARKEATTDGMKRALRQFGNVMGNCLYDKSYLDNIKRMKKEPATGFNPDLLYRPPALRPQGSAAPAVRAAQSPKRVQAPPPAMRQHAHQTVTAPANQTTVAEDFEDYELEFDENRIGFDELANFTIESPTSSSNEKQDAQKSNHPNYIPPGDFTKPRPVATVVEDGMKQTTITQQEANRLKALKIREEREQMKQQPQAAKQTELEPESVHAKIQAAEPGVAFQPAFMNARTLVTPGAEPARFDPKLQSPSIPRSAGVDLSKSTPIKRPGLATAMSESPTTGTSNIGSPLRRSMTTGSASPAPPGMPGGMVTRAQQFRAPSKLIQTTKANALLSAKRTNEALTEHPAGSATMNVAEDATADKRPRI